MQIIASGFFLGVFLLQFYPSLPNLVTLLSLLLLTLFFFLFATYSKSFFSCNTYTLIRLPIIFAMSALLSASYATFSAQSILDSRLQSDVIGKDVIVEGVIATIPQQQQDRWRFYLLVKKAHLTQKQSATKRQINLNGKLKLNWYHRKGKTHKPLQAGQTWRFQVRLKPPNGFMNNGSFDYEKWLFTHGVSATGYIRQSQHNTLLKKAPWYSLHYQRQQLANKIKQLSSHYSTSNNTSAIITALAVAVRDDINASQWTLLQQTGTTHLIAISGLHIGMIAALGYFIIALLWWVFPSLYQTIPVRIAGAGLAILFATLYAVLAGFTLPTQRSLIMVIAVVIALLQKQRTQWFNSISIAVILVLIIDPFAILSASFWLSFAAVILILIYAKRRQSKSRFSFIWLQLMLSLGMFPLTIFFFGSASLISPLANLIAIPWVTVIIVPLILFALLLLVVAPFLSAYVLQFAAFNIDYLLRVLAWLDQLPFTLLHFQALPLSLIIVMMLGLLFLFLPKGFPAKGLGLLLIIPIILFQPQRIQKEAVFRYTLLDVGQGLASLIETKHHTLLYDAGPRATHNFDTGKLVVLPFLQDKGIKRLDKMVLSHIDMDHRGGALAVLNEVSANEIISSQLDFLGKHPLTRCQAGQKWQWDGVLFEFIHPTVTFFANKISENNRSCVLRISNQHHSLLLTGDIEKEAEQSLLEHHKGTLKTEVLLIPHHGSLTSSTPDFIKAVAPRIALNSAGYFNKFKHPANKVIQRYQQNDISLYDNVRHGQITLLFPADNTPLQIERYRNKKLKFWFRNISDGRL
jgi:competence protein ComEC